MPTFGDTPGETARRFVAFCDILGFSNSVLERFDATVSSYNDFLSLLIDKELHREVEISVYSDAILFTSESFPAVSSAVKTL